MKKRNVKQEEPSREEVEKKEADPFVPLFTSLMVLLMTFFIVLVSMGSTSTAKLEEVQSSLDASFGGLGIAKSSELVWFINSFVYLSEKVGLKSSEEDKGDLTKGERIQTGFFGKGESKESVYKRISNLVISSSLVVKKEGERVSLVIAEGDIFRKGDPRLSNKGKQFLSDVLLLVVQKKKDAGEQQEENPWEKYKINIISHSQDENIALGFSHLSLSVKRLNAIAEFLHEQGNISTDNLSIKSFGDSHMRKEDIVKNRFEFMIS